jgi:hypothetical protein
MSFIRIHPQLRADATRVLCVRKCHVPGGLDFHRGSRLHSKKLLKTGSMSQIISIADHDSSC